MKQHQQMRPGRALFATSIAALVVCVLASAAGAAEPALEVAIDVSAPRLAVATYDVDASEEVDFLEAITTTGGYVGEQPGFAVEKVLRNIEGPVDGVVRVWVLTRHYNQSAMDRALAQRNAAVAPFVTSLPRVVHTEVDHHQFANWGLERREPVAFTGEEPSMDLQVLEEYGTTLAFFKYGYTGQIGWVQEHPAGKNLGAARAELLRHEGLSGASLARSADGRSVVTYAEFFATPASLAAQKQADGFSGLGTVILNYRER